MTDELDVLTRLVDYHDHIAAPTVPVADDVRRGRRRVARRRTLAAGGAALAAAGIVVTASLVTRGDPDSAPEPARSPNDKHTQTETDIAIDPVQRNGQITDTETHFAVKSYGRDWRAYDPVTDTGLIMTPTQFTGDQDLEGLEVVGPNGPVATLACDRDLPCSPEDEVWELYAATLGPGTDEVTVGSADGTARVIGYDGTARGTIDLTATVTDGGGVVRGLRWSADGNRLAVVTTQDLGRSTVNRVWLVDGEGGDPLLAYSLSYEGSWPVIHSDPDFEAEGAVWTASDWGWSPDGRTLLLDVYRGGNYAADVVLLHPQPDGATAQVIYRSNRHFDWSGNVAWSPDGTRIAVRTRVPGTLMKHRVTEISAEDGSVIAQHPHLNGWLIWPARED